MPASTWLDAAEMPVSCSGVSRPAPGRSRSMRKRGMTFLLWKGLRWWGGSVAEAAGGLGADPFPELHGSAERGIVDEGPRVDRLGVEADRADEQRSAGGGEPGHEARDVGAPGTRGPH